MTRWPRDAEDKMAALSRRPFAHRGLHGAGIPENTLAAFDAAISAGLGIELDVQATSDGDAIVFHDSELDRLTDQKGPIALRAAHELKAIRLRGSNQTISRLHDALIHIAGRTPLLIEAKSAGGNTQRLCLAIRRALEGYQGPVGVMSFDPEVSRWFSDHAPRIPHGLVISEEEQTSRPRLRNNPIARAIAIMVAQPGFLAYDIRSLPSGTASRARRGGRKVFTWTVTTEKELARAAAHADQFIVEGEAAALLGKGDGVSRD